MTNVAVVVLDTLRYDAFVDAFDWLDGARFTRAYSTTHWTIPAHASLFTGRYASEVGVHGQSPSLDCPDGTLAEAYDDAGYRTRCLTANTQLTQYEGWDRGFDEFVGPANLGRVDDSVFDWGGHVEATEPGLDRYLSGLWNCVAGDCNTVRSLKFGYDLVRKPKWDGGARNVRKRLRETEFGDDEFLFVNLMDAHTPYRPPEGEDDPVTVVVADAFSGGVDDPEHVREAYRASVEYLSEMYRDIYAELESEFDYVVTLSDHGELLGEHGLWNHSVSLHPELIHVPLVVSGPDVETGPRHEVVDLLDVHRTLAELGDVDVDSRGRDLFAPLEPTEHLFESHGLLPFHKAQFDREDVSEAEFHRWQTMLRGFVTEDGAYCYETDPDRNFRVIGETDLPDPRGRLEELVDSIETREVEAEDVSVTDEVRDRLEELGYA